MIRLVLLLAVGGVVIVLAAGRIDGSDGAPAPSAPYAPDAANIPPQFRALLAHRVDPAEVLALRGGLPGLSAVRPVVDGEEGPRTFADLGPRGAVRAVKRDVRRNLAAVNRITRAPDPGAAAVGRMLAAVYAREVLERLGPDGRRRLAGRVAGAVSSNGHVVRVLQFDGVLVSARRALAQLIYRRAVRAPSGRFQARTTHRWQVVLERERGRWRFVRGLEP